MESISKMFEALSCNKEKKREEQYNLLIPTEGYQSILVIYSCASGIVQIPRPNSLNLLKEDTRNRKTSLRSVGLSRDRRNTDIRVELQRQRRQEGGLSGTQGDGESSY